MEVIKKKNFFYDTSFELFIIFLQHLISICSSESSSIVKSRYCLSNFCGEGKRNYIAVRNGVEILARFPISLPVGV